MVIIDGAKPQQGRYHLQPSEKKPEFFYNGTKEVLIFRGAPQKEEFIRHWLQAITEFCKHQLDYKHTLIVRTALNTTPVFSDRVPLGSRQQYLHEPIITLACQSDTYKAHSEIVARTRKTFKLTGNHTMSHPLTLQGFHYEVTASSSDLKITAPFHLTHRSSHQRRSTMSSED